MNQKKCDPVYGFNKESGYFILQTESKNCYYITPTDQINPISQGNFGVVYKAVDNYYKPRAIKKIPQNESIKERIAFEIKLMIEMKHISCGHTIYAYDTAQDQSDIYIAMPLYEGTLTQVINQHYFQSELQIIEAFRQICFGLKCLHNKNIIHRDLKTDNILFKKSKSKYFKCEYVYCLADYGIAKELTNDVKHTQMVGTSYTKAPEVSTGNYDIGVDIFSMGCILYKMFTGNEPFTGNSEEDIYNNKMRKKLVEPKLNGHALSEFSMNLIRRCLEPDAHKRISPNELYELLKVEQLHYSPLMIEQHSLQNKENKQLNLLANSIGMIGSCKEHLSKLIDFHKKLVTYQAKLANTINHYKQIDENHRKENKKVVMNKALNIAKIINYDPEKGYKLEGVVKRASKKDPFNEAKRSDVYLIINNEGLNFYEIADKVPFCVIKAVHCDIPKLEFWYDANDDYKGRNFKIKTIEEFSNWHFALRNIFKSKNINIEEQHH